MTLLLASRHPAALPLLPKGAASGALVAVLGALVLLACLAATVQSLLSSTVAEWRPFTKGALTVEVAALPQSSEAQDKRVRDVVDALQRTPGVLQAEALPRERSLEMLRPWLEDSDMLRDLPLPVLVDVMTDPQARIQARDLETSLARVASGVSVDDHAAFARDLRRLARFMEHTAIGVLALVAIVLILGVTIICHAGLAVHRPAIELLHVLGSPDASIAALFRHHATRLAALGALTGASIAAVIVVVAGSMIARLGLPLPEADMWMLGVNLLGVPMILVFGTALAAQISVHLALHRQF